MTTDQMNSEAQPADDGEISLLDLLIVFAKYKKRILGVSFVVAVLAAGMSWLMPNVYTASARILPPQSNQSSSVASMMLGQLGGLAGMAGGALGLKDPNALYVAMLQSRNIMEKVAVRFDLQKVYDEKLMADTLRDLTQATSMTAGKDGVILVEVSDKDPQRAAAIANAFVEELDKLVQTYAITDAAHRRQFFETQMKPARDKLTDAEVTLDRTPNTSLQYFDALRNLKYQEGVYEVLAKQFELAKLDEAKDAPLIQILDKAAVPERKAKPKRALIVILAAMAAFFLMLIWAFAKEALAKASSEPEQAGRLQELRRLLRWRSAK